MRHTPAKLVSSGSEVPPTLERAARMPVLSFFGPTSNARAARRRQLCLILSIPLFAAGVVRVARGETQVSDPGTYDARTRPLIQQYCAGCHSGSKASGGVDLAAYPDVLSIQKDQTTWRKVLA